jgi:hypothetical protein
MSVLCIVTADTSRIPSTMTQLVGVGGNLYYEQHFTVVLLFGLTELKAQLRWMENVRSQTHTRAFLTIFLPNRALSSSEFLVSTLCCYSLNWYDRSPAAIVYEQTAVAA